MNTLRVIAIVVGYLAAGWVFARLRLAQLEGRARREGQWLAHEGRREAREDMLAVFLLWPVLVPLYALVAAVRFVLYPRSVR